MMVRRLMYLALILPATGALWAGPVDGPTAFRLHVPASKPGDLIGEADFTRDFRGGQRASVIIIGDHKPVVDLEVHVYEVSGSKERLVARDKGGKDVIGAVWVPTRTGPFRVVIRNPSEYKEKINPYNDCYIVIK